MQALSLSDALLDKFFETASPFKVRIHVHFAE